MARIDAFEFRHDGLLHTFQVEAVPSKFISAETKRTIFKDIETCLIYIPGSKNQITSHEITEDLIERKGWREFYDKWKSGAGTALDGTPIAHFEDLTPGQIKSLEANSIKTIEAFAELDDSLLTIVGPEGRTLRDKARVIVGFSADEGVKALKASNEMLTKQMEEMRAQIAAMSAPKPEAKAKGKKAADPQDPFATEQAA